MGLPISQSGRGRPDPDQSGSSATATMSASDIKTQVAIGRPLGLRAVGAGVEWAMGATLLPER